MKIRYIMAVMLLVGMALNIQAQDGLYKVVYEADKEGNQTAGSLEELLRHVRSGNPVRVGWTFVGGRLEHWADAGFITIIKDHVFAQINPIFGQATSAPSEESPAVYLHTAEPNSWVAIIGTTGEMRQKFKRDPELIKAYKEMGLNDEEIEVQLKKNELSRFSTKWSVLIKD